MTTRPVHDALAVAHVIDPDLLTTRAPAGRDRRHPRPLPRPHGRRPAPAHGPPSRTPHVAVDVDADALHRPADRAGSRSPAVSDAEFPFQRRLGAFPLRNGRTEFRVWAPSPMRSAARRRRRPRARARRLRHLRGDGRRRRRATTTSSSLDGDAAARPVLALAAARACAARRGSSTRSAFEWTDGDFRTPGLHDAVIYELHVGTFSPEGTFDGAIPYLQAPRRARRDRDRADARGRVPRRARLELRRRLPERRPVLLRRPARAPAARRRRARRSASAVMLDVVYNHVGASGTKALLGLRPVLHRTSTRRPGAPASTSTASTATPSASGSARAPSSGCATSTSTACGWTRSTRSSTRAPSTSWPRSRAACTPSTRARS